MLLDQRVTDARYNRVSVYTHLIAAMGMGEHVGMVSKAYLLPLGDIIIRLYQMSCVSVVVSGCRYQIFLVEQMRPRARRQR